MAFFDASLAAQVQYFTLPLEALGFTLAAIEIRMENISTRLVTWINATEARLDAAEDERRASEQSPLQRAFDRYLPIRTGYGVRANRLAALAMLSVCIPFVAVSAAPTLGLLDAGFADVLLSGPIAWAFNAVATVVALPLLLYLMLRFATRFAPGREVGNLGLLIAALGLIGELYQFVTPFVLRVG